MIEKAQSKTKNYHFGPNVEEGWKNL
jgi:hypothetical protein